MRDCVVCFVLGTFAFKICVMRFTSLCERLGLVRKRVCRFLNESETSILSP